jgi:hypothetical protein
VVLRLECTVCKYKMQMALKRCKQCVSYLHEACEVAHTSFLFSFELGGEKKTKGAALTFVRSPLLLPSSSISRVFTYSELNGVLSMSIVVMYCIFQPRSMRICFVSLQSPRPLEIYLRLPPRKQWHYVCSHAKLAADEKTKSAVICSCEVK